MADDQQPPQFPPPPPLGDSTHCPRCGQRLILGAAHCPYCGQRLAPGPEPLSIAGMVFLALGSLICGSVGTCSLLGIVSTLLTPRGPSSLAISFVPPGVVASYLAILGVRRILESIQARRDKPSGPV